MERREFLKTSAATMLGAMSIQSIAQKEGISSVFGENKKRRLLMVGTGARGTNFWGRALIKNFPEKVEFVGLCDTNIGRLAYAKEKIGTSCQTSTNFEQLLRQVQPDMIIVTTPDSLHDEYIVKGLQYGADVITEKPMTTDEKKCKAILDAQKKAKGRLIVGFNYRYIDTFTRLKELVQGGDIGAVTSVDFHWYLNVYHGADYFRRWHALRRFSGTLLVHKATHHFDLLNWILDSDPSEVFAIGALEHYGKNNPFRHTHCRACPHKSQCAYYFDITQNEGMMKLYVANEKYDGYLRDACVWRKEIDIYDKMGVLIKYANGIQVNYSLTTYSPFEGWSIAFNGTKGRIEAWEGIPWLDQMPVGQDQLHALEMSQEQRDDLAGFNRIMLMKNFASKHQEILVPTFRTGHGGGDVKMQERIFGNPNAPDPLRHAAGSRDGAMSILIGIAARKSIDQKKPVKIADLVDLKPQPVRPIQS